jgi:alkanesulfonate monooxygenase SsuD/methylene tetrahydromethanopterin reductase-like flavin-dependent oxidoreductase (luciferase family)
MRSLWRDDVASFDGKFVGFEAIRVNPKPVRDRRIPVVVGGNSDAALRRVAAWGDGWYGFNLAGVAGVRERIDRLAQLCAASGRDRAGLRLSVALRNPGVGDVGALAELGVDEMVIVGAPPESPGAAAGWVSALADRWMGALT